MLEWEWESVRAKGSRVCESLWMQGLSEFQEAECDCCLRRQEVLELQEESESVRASGGVSLLELQESESVRASGGVRVLELQEESEC